MVGEKEEEEAEACWNF